MIDPRDVICWKLILLRERAPASLADEKFVRQAELQLRVVTQIADLMNLQSLCRLSPHDQGIGIVETKLVRHADTKLRQLLADHRRRGRRRSFQNFFADRAGVFRIKSDLAGPKRLPKNDRPSHSLAVFRRDAGILERAFRDLREDIRFREFFRADQDWLRQRS